MDKMHGIAIIVGNGSSLSNFDFRNLKDMAAFGMNAAYRYWDRIGWYPTFYSCLDEQVGSSHATEIKRLIENAEKYNIKKLLLRSDLIQALKITKNLERVVDFDILKGSYEALNAPTITTGSHTAAWAASLGYKEIYMLGIDSNYVEVVPGAQIVKGHMLEMAETPKENPNYFFNDYHQKGDKYFVPNPNRAIHLESWREVAACLLDGDTCLLNANFKSKVDAVDFCHFADLNDKGKPEIVPRGHMKLVSFFLNHIVNIKNDEEKQSGILQMVGPSTNFPVQPYLDAGWKVEWFNSTPSVREKNEKRFGTDAIKFQNTPLHVEAVKQPFHLNVADGENMLEQIERLTARHNRPDLITIEIDQTTTTGQRATIQQLGTHWNTKGYQCMLLKRNSNKLKGETVTTEYQLLPFNETHWQQLNTGLFISSRLYLDTGLLAEEIHGLNLLSVQRKLRMGFVFHSIIHTLGVQFDSNTFQFTRSNQTDYLAYTFKGRLHPGELAESTISFSLDQPATLTIMLCRDGKTPFEHQKKKVVCKSGLNQVRISTRFTAPHYGLRVQVFAGQHNIVLRDITTTLQIQRSNNPVHEAGIYEEGIPVVLIPDEQLQIQEQATHSVIPLKTRLKRKSEWFFWSTINQLFPVGSKRRAFLGRVRRKISLLIQKH